MLGVLRRNKNSPIITILLGIVALLMLGFGISFQGSGRAGYAARVNGEPIGDAEYGARYANVYRSKQSQDRSYDRDRAQKERLREGVLYGMITTKILAQRARDFGLAVDDEALRRAILDNEVFHTDGRFDRQLYERVLNYQQTPHRAFEEQERERLAAESLLGLLQSLTVSEAEVQRMYDIEQKKVNLRFVQIAKKDFEGAVGTIALADAKALLERPEAGERLEAYYKKHKSTKFDLPKRICAQHILARADESTPPDLKAEKRESIKQALAAVKGGMDFALAAKKFSEDANKEKGGDLGCFGAGEMLPQVEEVAFGLEVGQVSPIVETPFGYHVVKVTDVKEPVRKKLEDAREEIALELVKEERAGELAKVRAQAISLLAKQKGSLEAGVAALPGDKAGLEIKDTGEFGEGRDFVPRIGMAKEVARAAWKLTKEAPLAEGPLETDKGWVVVELNERTEPDPEAFGKIRPSLLLTLSGRKQNALFESWSKALREEEKVEIHPLALSYETKPTGP